MVDAVDCKTPLGSCCPKGTMCNKTGAGWEIEVTCTPAGTAAVVPATGSVVVDNSVAKMDTAIAAVPGKPVCKPGPPERLSKTMKNCLVIGDSVSIGYTPFLASVLAEDCFMQVRMTYCAICVYIKQIYRVLRTISLPPSPLSRQYD